MKYLGFHKHLKTVCPCCSDHISKSKPTAKRQKRSIKRAESQKSKKDLASYKKK